jgi:hypothetical protein
MMRARNLLIIAALSALPLTAGAEVVTGCHQAAFVGPIGLGVESVGLPSLVAVGEVVLVDGTVLADGQSILPGEAVLHGVFRNAGADPVGIALGDGDRLHLEPRQTVSVATAVEIENERICVCECKCFMTTVRIRCDSSTMDCSTLNGEICEDEDGDEFKLEGCTKKFVIATATPTTP